MPSGSKICVRMNVKNGSSAAASTAALTRIQPKVEYLYWVSGSNCSGSSAKLCNPSDARSQCADGM